jgi:drug/metabolite transporter (DMT)-like permease
MALWQRQAWPQLSPRQWALLWLCAFLMLYLNQICLTLGVQRTAAANAALIIALNPLVSALMAASLLGDRLTPSRLAGVVLGFAGVSSVVLSRPGAELGQGGLGDLLVFGAVLTWVAGGALVQRLARHIDTATISTWVTGLGTLMLAAHVAVDPGSTVPPLASLTPQHWLMLGLSGVFATAVGALVWNNALRRLGVARAALYAYWVPIFGVLFAVALLDEQLTPWHGVGLAAVCDVLVVAEGMHLCLSEAKVGLLPATIGPYVLRALGEQASRRYFVTAERFSAAEAHRLGFAHECVAPEQLDATVARICDALVANGPLAVQASKRLLQDLSGRELSPALRDDTARRIADVRASAEGKEGVAAFLEKRNPAWRA